MIEVQDITGLVLSGGRGVRMGGADKGLQLFNGVPLALHALRRLAPQVGALAVNANRNLAAYEAFGAPVVPDETGEAGDYPGPLAGLLAGLAHARTPWLACVPCDTPRFPHDLVKRLAQGAATAQADIAIASAPGVDGLLHGQPVVCLMRTSLTGELRRFIAEGGRAAGAWAAARAAVHVAFDAPGDDPHAFGNANTREELERLQAP